jgi:hypothetical protein
MKTTEVEFETEGKQKKYGKFDEWEIKCAVDTLQQAEEIKADAEKMKHVGPLLQKKVTTLQKTITSLQDLRDLRNKKSSEDEEETEG